MKIFLSCLLLLFLRPSFAFAQKAAAMKPDGVAAIGLSAIRALGEEAAPQQRVSAPMIGYVSDRTTSVVRPILGVPGAARLGGPVVFESASRHIEISPAGSYGLGISQDSGAVTLLDLSTGATGPVLGAAWRNPHRIVFSPSGTAAALYRRDLASAQVIRGLPATPAIGDSFEWSQFPGILTGMALADDGETLLAVLSDRGGDSVFTLRPGAAPLLVGVFQKVSALSFLPGSGSALIADWAASKLWLAENVTASGALTALADEHTGISGPVAVAASTGGDTVMVLNGGTSTLSIIKPALAASTTIPCPCKPAGFFPTASQQRWRLTAPGSSPMAILDASQPEPAIVLAPAVDENPPTLSEPASRPGRRRGGQ